MKKDEKPQPFLIICNGNYSLEEKQIFENIVNFQREIYKKKNNSHELIKNLQPHLEFCKDSYSLNKISNQLKINEVISKIFQCYDNENHKFNKI